jgi:monoamine oxidase
VTFGPGQLLAALPFLRRRYGRLRLAGEHTDEWAGYMEGALRSGARVARSIVSDDESNRHQGATERSPKPGP